MDAAESLVETLRWLVDIPSETGDEDRICTAVAERLGNHPSQRVRESLVVGAPDGRPKVLLAGHLDTVPRQGQGPAHIADDRLWGLGSADMKAGVATIIHLLEDPTVTTGPYNVIAVFYSGEEGRYADNQLADVLTGHPFLADASCAVVLEPSDGELQYGCTGAINATVTFRGSSAHSARPWWGENAISKAGEWLAGMHRLEPEDYEVDGMVFRQVASVTMAEGGIARNVIPAEFRCNVNLRFTPDRSVDDARKELERLCAVADEIEITDIAPSGPVDSSHPVFVALAARSGAKKTAKQGWTDVARFGEIGVPAVNFGPGETSRAHQVDESVPLDQLAAVWSALRATLSGDR